MSKIFAWVFCVFAWALAGSVFAQTPPAQQPAPPPAITAPDTAPNTATTDIDAKLRQYFELHDAQYRARKDELATERKALDTLFYAAYGIGVIVAAVAIALTFFVGKSARALREEARTTALSAFEAALRDKSKVAEGLEKTADELADARKQLETVKEELSGYQALSQTAQYANADPLSEYYPFRDEIQKRRANKLRHHQGDETVQVSDTTDDAEFRQKVAVVFGRLLDAVRKDAANNYSRIAANDLFNVAASASEADADFEALELMEAAFKIDAGAHPEIEARLIRQRMNASRITPAAAKAAMAKALARVSGFDLHLVVSEAFNIGLQTADPAGVARLINDSVQEGLRDVSYTKLNGARLLFMGNSPADWDLGMQWYCEGLAALSREIPSARWYQHSMNEIGKILEERHDIFDACEHMPLARLLGKSASLQDFARRYGAGLATSLIRLKKIDQFIEEGEEGARMQALLEALRKQAPPQGMAREDAPDPEP